MTNRNAKTEWWNGSGLRQSAVHGGGVRKNLQIVNNLASAQLDAANAIWNKASDCLSSWYLICPIDDVNQSVYSGPHS